MNLKVLKKGGFCDMIRIINKKIKMNKEIRSRIEGECNFVNKVPKIKERKLENCRTYKSCLCRPHRVIIDNINYLFFNEHNYFYLGSLSNKYAISDFRKIIGN